MERIQATSAVTGKRIVLSFASKGASKVWAVGGLSDREIAAALTFIDVMTSEGR
jgi:hypothetical protein